jgi:tRNA(Ile)-lysidine synthase
LGRARTLGGCRVQRRSGSLIIGRESGRMSGEPVRIEPGETLIWDDRFKIRLGREGGKSLMILPLGKAKDVAQVKRPKNVPNFVFKALPALIREGQVALVPHIGYRGAGFSGLKAEVVPLVRHLIIH